MLVRMEKASRGDKVAHAFAAVLRDVRLEKGLSQEKLALDSGYHRTYVSLLERGRQNPSLRTVLALAAVLKVPAASLVEKTERRMKGGSEPVRTP